MDRHDQIEQVRDVISENLPLELVVKAIAFYNMETYIKMQITYLGLEKNNTY